MWWGGKNASLESRKPHIATQGRQEMKAVSGSLRKRKPRGKREKRLTGPEVLWGDIRKEEGRSSHSASICEDPAPEGGARVEGCPM